MGDQHTQTPRHYLRRECYTVTQAMRLLGVSRITLFRRRRNGTLPYVEFNSRVVMYPKDQLQALLIKEGRLRNGSH